MPEIIIDELTEVSLIVEESIENISMNVTDESETVTMDSLSDIIVRYEKDYDRLDNRPAINGHLLVGGENSLEDIGIHNDIPSGGLIGDILTKRSLNDYDCEWITPANHAEKDNTRPITAGAVYAEIGNINALLATI